MKKQSLQELMQWMKTDASIAPNIEFWHTVEERPARTAAFPEQLHERLRAGLAARGIDSLYTHQHSAFEEAYGRKANVVTITPTASGKTLCYNLPVLQTIMDEPEARALYLFPTKALAQDQKSEINEFIEEIGASINSYTYDGDTPPTIRQSIRRAGHIVMTNPDMLHSAILPHHTKWVSLFEHLRYIVIDEIHTYRGVFGSHVANVLRRLLRIARYYGAEPTFITTSATIANPRELAETLTEQPFELVDNNGAPQGKKHFVFYNPPVINEAMNIRKGVLSEVNRLANTFLEQHVQTIVFTKSRVMVEVILSHLQHLNSRQTGQQSLVTGYRGGYLPNQRRAIEEGLRSGEIMGVISTNALELGVDIGQLQVCIMSGYPGSIASAWQQAGRAGRRQSESLIVMIASSNPIDQYMIQHSDYFLEKNPETARIHPDNLIILVDHVKCAAFELPFRDDDTFGGVDVSDVLEYLSEENVVHHRGSKWYWMSDSFPAHGISLRSASQENVVIIDQTVPSASKVIGQMDRFSAMTLLHDEAIYIHQGVQYQVVYLDWDEKKAYVEEVRVDYYTDANMAVELKVLEEDKTADYPSYHAGFGDVMVHAKVTIFKKIKLTTFENIGSGTVHLPEEELHTNACWIHFPGDTVREFGRDTLEQAMMGLANVLRHTAPVRVMCDPSDIHVVPQMKATHSEQPTIFLYDRYPGGVGLSSTIFTDLPDVLRDCASLIDSCPCQDGCPSCIGSDIMLSGNTKATVLAFIHRLQAEQEVSSSREHEK
ncbi:DEAD/DEAH box helicase domain-containing protein [Marinococcus luteus]|uniref:DEAD/DEAH box helicase domain-containing protein n=1 Tax=Marinococcus luteus TaxID=1122204 RepID=A0A1H2R5C1_9BACI|nr:DEAD/DEAH box helicase [Marinococcus luteus]SDW14064.1 DEAD/DEAH box helicase domain-containing protein [Marinococcus luteus]